ncbi:MAG: ThiF family adenylyltransferase [Eubacteriales bacterium]|nr:ThiF family adenylyltransferase [Eubacteriales bacterium]
MQNENYYDNIFQREKLLLGNKIFNNITTKSIVLCGIGGVGSYALEGLCRMGINKFVLIDDDKYELSNINRQLYATNNTIGKYKINVAKNRILDINPTASIITFCEKIQNIDLQKILFQNNINYDNIYLIDAIDDVNGKSFLISFCLNNNIKIVSSMGTGNKIYASKMKISTLDKTSTCPLSKKLRKILSKKYSIELLSKVNVIYSDEVPKKICNNPQKLISSISYVPAIAGMLICEYIINNIISEVEK